MATDQYSEAYTEDSFWKKLQKFAIVAGKEVVEKALTLYETLKDADTPAWAKSVIIVSLGYFISPVDTIPDAIPLAGYADDLGGLAAALAAVAMHVKDEHVASARATLTKWFGAGDEG